jgi:glutamate-1-semialdehyde 2,1-aminomutase
MADWQQRARRCLAGGVSSQFRAADPVVFSHGRGSRIWDVDGREYIDYTLSQGPLIHGHSHPEILAAVTDALGRGQIWNGLHTDEIELGERLVESVPCADLVRIGCTGSEAVHAALRLARAVTARPKIVKFEGHYHGWFDNIIASINPPLEQLGPEDSPVAVAWTTGLARGSLDDVVVLPWNDAEAVGRAVDRHKGEVAAIITEPCMCNSGCVEPRPGFLAELRRVCDGHGIVLIYDEVITGFRLALGGAQQRYGVTPDLAVFGKAVAGGFPLSVLAGRGKWMSELGAGRPIHAGTLNAHVGGVAAALASLRLLAADDGAAYRRLYHMGGQLKSGLAGAAAQAGQRVLVSGPGPMFHLGFVRSDAAANQEPAAHDYRGVARLYDMAKYGRFVAAMAGRGVRLIGRGIWYISTAHHDADIAETLDAARAAMAEVG